MKKLATVALIILPMMGYASKLSKFVHDHNERERARDERGRQQQAEIERQDMNFADFVFKLDRRYTNDRNHQCRDYIMRSRSNPYKNGIYTICNER